MTHREKAEHNALNTVFYEELEMFDDPELEINITYLRRNWREHLKRKARDDRESKRQTKRKD